MFFWKYDFTRRIVKGVSVTERKFLSSKVCVKKKY